MSRMHPPPRHSGGTYLGVIVIGTERWSLTFTFDESMRGAVVLIGSDQKKHTADERATSIDEAKRIGWTLAHVLVLNSKDPQTPTPAAN